jgi:hypothetical protein
MKESIQLYCLKNPSLKKDTLMHQDWQLLTDISVFLEPLNDATLVTEGYDHGVNRVIPSIDFLFQRLEEGVERNWASPQMHISINAASTKLDKYYALTDKSLVHVASEVLNSCWKWRYFERGSIPYPQWIPPA